MRHPRKNFLKCPKCGGRLECMKTEPRDATVRRIRVCLNCKSIFTTIERFLVTGNEIDGETCSKTYDNA